MMASTLSSTANPLQEKSAKAGDGTINPPPDTMFKY